MADPVSTVWPKPVADFLTHDGPGLGIKRVAMLYATNDFTGTQANAIRKFIKESNSGVEIVFDEGIPTDTSNYTVLINNIRASSPDAVLHLGYAPNDIAFLRNVQDSGMKFKFLFCHLSWARNRSAGKERRQKGAELCIQLRTVLGDRLRNQFRHAAERLSRGVAQKIRRQQSRVRIQFGCRLHHGPGAGKGAIDRGKP